MNSIKSRLSEDTYKRCGKQDELLNVGDVTLYFLNAKTMKRSDMPEKIKEKLVDYFK
jgi:acyl-CoA thioesterase FadM